jgi:hypothetical protein
MGSHGFGPSCGDAVLVGQQLRKQEWYIMRGGGEHLFGLGALGLAVCRLKQSLTAGTLLVSQFN